MTYSGIARLSTRLSKKSCAQYCKTETARGMGTRATFVSLLSMLVLFASSLHAQTNVVTQHNDIARTGQNTNETILTPANVNTNTFGKLFSYSVDGQTYAQPLYMQGVTMGAGTAQAGTTHNVVFVATEHDSVFAFDADSNGGANAAPLWQITLLDSAHGAGSGATTVPNGDLSTSDISPEIGITSTPVIDPSTNTLYVVGKTKENGNYFQRLHALDITTGAEKSGSPVTLSGQVPGNGNGSSGGVLSWDPKWENNRPGLLLLNGIVYIGFAAHGDNGPWHGWILAYNAATLQQTSVFCSTANGAGSGVWMSGAGLAADTVSNSSGNPSPGGRLFVATGNGAFTATAPPYTNTMSYGDDFVRLDLSSGVMTVGDQFTPLNQSTLSGGDVDVASGGVLVLPDQSSGGHTHLMVQAGKEGRIFLVDRDNLGGYSSSGDNIVQEVPVNNASQSNQTFKINGLWSSPAYWNGNLYFWGEGDNLKAFSFSNGKLGNLDGNGLPSPTSTSAETAGYPGAIPAISSNGTSNGIVWSILTAAYSSGGSAVLIAHSASNVSTTLYSSNQNSSRDNPGLATKFAVPTIINGNVYVGTSNYLSVYGPVGATLQAAAPMFSPGGESFTGSVSVTITDTTPNSSIYYTTNGSTPTTSSTPYTGPITVTSSETINAIANASGYTQSSVASETYNLQTPTQAVAPTFSPLPGTYSSTQSVTLSSTATGAAIYYTTNGSTPTSSSTRYTGPISVSSTETIEAITVATGYTNSSVSSGVFTINASGGTGVNLGSGFTAGAMVLNGNATLNGTKLQLTDSGTYEAGSAWYNAPLNIQQFSTSFSFQLTPGTSPLADGFTFTIQASGTTALGPDGGGLGYGPDNTSTTVSPSNPLHNSVAVKFDLYNDEGEGDDSTGLYTNGASPTTPFVDLTSSGINLQSGDVFNVQMSYDGTNLTMTITDPTVNASFTQVWPVNIPSIVGANSAYVGFTGGTGGSTAVQSIIGWTFSSSPGTVTTTSTPVITPGSGTFTSAQSVTITDGTAGAAVYYTVDGSQPTTSSTKYEGAFTVGTTTTVKAIAVANGVTSGTATSVLTIQSASSGSLINFASGFSAAGMQFNGNATLVGSNLKLTDTATNFEDSSAFWTQKVNVQGFTNDFTFQITSPGADGFTFNIQGVGDTALGGSGGNLGYASIGSSVAVKFDIYNNAGEGTNSTGLFTNGATPTVPATTLGGGVSLQSGDVMAVHMTYDGTTLSMTITDKTTAQTFTTSWPINIPSTVGGTTAYVGFTGATGGSVSNQQILTWTYSGGNAPLVFQTASLASAAVSSGPTFRVFSYGGFPDGNGTILDATNVGDNVTFTLNVPTADIYDVKVSYKQYQPRGNMQTTINSTNLGSPIDEYIASGDAYAVTDLGAMNFASAGNYLFKFTVTGKDTSSTGYSISFDDITLTPQ